jgi:hypothetical protein
MIKSLVVIFPYKKVLIIRYSLLFHVKSNDNFVNCYFSHTKYVSLTLIVTNPHTKYNVEQSVGWLKEWNIDWDHFWPPLNLAGQPLQKKAKIVISLPFKKSYDYFVRSLVLLEKNNDYFVTFFLTNLIATCYLLLTIQMLTNDHWLMIVTNGNEITK